MPAIDSRTLWLSGSQAFNATTSDINLGPGTGVHAPTAQTILAYFRPDGAGEGNYSYLFAQTPSASANGPRFYYGNQGAGFQIGIGSTSGSNNTPYFEKTLKNGNPNGLWVHFAGTWDGGLTAASAFKLYTGYGGKPLTIEDGTTYGSSNGTVAGTGSGNNMHVGNREGADRTLNGAIGYVARWNRVLSLEELRKAQRLGPLSVPNGLILCWANGRDYSPHHRRPTSVTSVTRQPVRGNVYLRAPNAPRFVLLGEASGATYAESITDSAAATDTAPTQHILRDALTDSAAATESISSIHAAVEVLTDSAAATDATSSSHVSVNAVTDAAASTDSVASALVAAEVLTDPAAATDAASSAFVGVDSLSDTAAATDAASGSVASQTYTESVADSAGASDAMGCAAVLGTVLEELAAGSDIVVVEATATEAMSDAAAATDAAASTVGAQTYTDVIEDDIAATDAVGSVAIRYVVSNLAAGDRRAQFARRINVQVSRRINAQGSRRINAQGSRRGN